MFKGWGEKLRQAARERRRLSTMGKAFHTVRQRQEENEVKIRGLEERKTRLRRVREESLGHEGLLKLALENLAANGVTIRRANTREEALAYLVEEIGDEKLIVKSKSNATKEIGLTEHLEARGVEVVETDIGDRIVQLAGEKPCHPTGPAAHLDRYDIAAVLSAHLGREVAPEPDLLTRLFKEDVSEKIEQAKIGITGANAITAEEGGLLFIHNEGNLLRVMMRPKKHIVVATIDKVYPNLDEAINMARLVTFYATGAIAPGFINIVTGPSKTADIEKKLIRGVHGPEEVVLILLDNGRSQVAQGDFRELLYCIGCGKCLVECPAYAVYGPHFGHVPHMAGRGLLYTSQAQDLETAKEGGLYQCLTCGHCTKHCPVGIDVPALMRKLRALHPERIPEPHLDLACWFAESHLKYLFTAARLEVLSLIAAVFPKVKP